MSVKWAATNLGACDPQSLGLFYAWGETGSKSDYSWAAYSLCNGTYDSLTKYCTKSSWGEVDGKTILESEDDAAYAASGGKWRTPTYDEWLELRKNTIRTWTDDYNDTGVAGRIFTSTVSGYEGASIFLPACGQICDEEVLNAGTEGFYWSSSLRSDGPQSAYGVYFTESKVDIFYESRYLGFSIRPVQD